MAVNELWHYSVYDPDKNMCYFGLVRIESFLNMIQNNAAPAEEIPAEAVPGGSSTTTGQFINTIPSIILTMMN